TEHQGSAGITESPASVAEIVRRPVAERRAERLREGDREPVEGFRLGSNDRVDVDGAERPMPGDEGQQYAGKEQQRAARIANSQGPVGEIGKRRPAGGRGDDR